MDIATIGKEELATICQRYGARRLSLFGSVLRGDNTEESDVDILVEFDASARIGYFQLCQMELDLADLIGRKIDLRTAGELSRFFRDEVVTSAREL